MSVTAKTAALWTVILVLLLAACTPKNQKEVANSLPNIMVLIADDAGWEDFGCYGNTFIKTPNVDWLANNGLKASNTFLTTAQCSPSRISILTGKYPHATGAEDLHMPMPDSLNIIPYYIREKGYFSGYLKKGHFGDYAHSQFDWYHQDLNQFNTFLDSAQSSPFFMWVGFKDPHRPYYDGIIDNPQSPDSVNVPPYLIDDDSTRIDLARYYNHIRRMDAQIGNYLDELRERDLLNNTLIIFLSDNGAPFPRAKGTVYDAGVKTPFVVCWPEKIKPGTETNELLSVIDLAPTLLNLVGIDPPIQFQGTSIRGLLSKDSIKGRNYVFSERNWHNCDEHIRSVRSERFKLIKNAYVDRPLGVASDIGKSPSFKSLLKAKNINQLNHSQALIFDIPRMEYELYDIATDPYELHNLANNIAYNSIYRELKDELTSWMTQTYDFAPSERQRYDNVDRFTGKRISEIKLTEYVKEESNP